MSTPLQYNSQTGNYEAIVENTRVSVDADEYAECRRAIMKDLARGQGLEESTLNDLPDEVYNRLYDTAEAEIEYAEWWMMSEPIEGVTITPLDKAGEAG